MSEHSWRAVFAACPPRHAVLVAPDRSWNADEIHAELLALAGLLRGCRVAAVLADNSPAWVIADLACQDSGVVHLPLPDFFTSAQLRHALQQCGADALLTDQPERVGSLDLGFCITGRRQGLTWMRRVIDAPPPLPAGTAKISFTSGSTGDPKGVCLSADGLLDTAQAVGERLADLALDRHLAVLPLALLLENVAGVYAPLLRGIPVCLSPLSAVGWRGASGFDPEGLDTVVEEARAGSLILVPELLKAWTAWLAHSGNAAPGYLRFVAVGGACVAPELIEAARAVGIPAYQGYGLTEGGSVLALNRPGDDGAGVGRPLRHVRLSIQDGELFARTRAFCGYAGVAERHAGDFPTGDLATMDARGHLHLAGRRKNLLITSFGRNVSPEWVEAGLLADPRILQAVVVGDSRPALSAIIVPRPGIGPVAIHGAVSRINASLPQYAQLLHYLVSEPFTAANGLATGNGRPRRQRIIDHHAAAIAALYSPEVSHDVVL